METVPKRPCSFGGCSKRFLHSSPKDDNRDIVMEHETREFVSLSNDALQKSYDQIQQLKKTNGNSRKTVRQLEIKLQSLEFLEKKSKRTSFEERENIFSKSDNSLVFNDKGHDLCLSRHPSLPSFAKYNVFASKLEFRRDQHFGSSTPPNPRADQENIRNGDKNKHENLFTNFPKLKDIAVKSNRSLRQSFRQSFLKRSPSELQLSLRNQLEIMQKEKSATIHNLKVIRKQKQNALDTLMRTIEVHSQTLQCLLQRKLEGSDERTKILSPKIELFKALHKDLRRIEMLIAIKLTDVQALQAVKNTFCVKS